MRKSVVLWLCTCGLRYKAICEIHRETSPKTTCDIRCKTCQRVIRVEGTVMALFQEIDYERWWKRLVPRSTDVAAQNLPPATFRYRIHL